MQGDANLANIALAKRVHLSPSACLVRVKALESSGLIRHYLALLDPQLRAQAGSLQDRAAPLQLG